MSQQVIIAGMTGSCVGVLCADSLQSQDANDLSDVQVASILSQLVAAGADTTASTLKNFFKLMALFPEKQKAAQRGQSSSIWLVSKDS